MNAKGSKSTSTFPVIELEEGWVWDGPWQIDISGHVDEEGWSYAPDFSTMKDPPKKGSEKKKVIDFTRRRKWIRNKKTNSNTKKNTTSIITSSIKSDDKV